MRRGVKLIAGQRYPGMQAIHADNAAKSAENTDIVVLAVKPQVLVSGLAACTRRDRKTSTTCWSYRWPPAYQSRDALGGWLGAEAAPSCA